MISNAYFGFQIWDFGFRIGRRAVLVAAISLCVVSGRAQETVHYQAKPGSKVSIAGTSTIHNWTMDSQIIGGFLDVPAGVVFDKSQVTLAGVTGGKLAAHGEVTIPVTSLKSEHEGMDEVMQQAMNAPTHPKIQFRLTEMTLHEPHTAGTPFQFDTKGDLVINGQTNSVAIPVAIENIDQGRLKITGKVLLKMSSYKVNPPKIALRMITTGDEITVTFDWLVGRPPAPKAP